MDKLYGLAFAFKKTKLWKLLYDSQLFAVRHTDGSIGYCCVMGNLGEHIALALYPGETGLHSYCEIAQEFFDSGIHASERILAQDCMSCSFENKDDLRESEIAEVRAYCKAHRITLRGQHAWPKFLRLKPWHMPWTIREEKDKEHLAEALEAAIQVAERIKSEGWEHLGLEAGPPFGREIPLLVPKDGGYDWQKTKLPESYQPAFPKAGHLYDLTLKRASMAKKTASIWSCDIMISPQPVSNEAAEGKAIAEPYHAPFFPWVQIIYNETQDIVLDTSVCSEDEEYEEVFPNHLLDTVAKLGKPRKLLVETQRVFTLYEDLAGRLGIKLELVDECEGLDEAVAGFYEGLEEDGDEFDDLEDAEKEMIEILSTCKDFSMFPDEALLLLSGAVKMFSDRLPRSQIRLLEEEMRRRFQ